ncbi:MAG: isoprenyl transferase [Bacteroidales bacterium]|jgi:undecaprenyl diphosphate synthase|nr:isoprenyl transferase [Bacteroidales bacterium]
MISSEDLKTKPIPKHVAIIMDGNGRWAKQRNKPRIEGHTQGATALRSVLEGCIETGIEYLTVYAFSIENWHRSPVEVGGLMNLFIKSCHTEIDNLNRNNIRFRAIGKLDMLDSECYQELKRTEEKTKNNEALQLVVALSYGSRWEIAHAAKQIAKAAEEHRLNSEQVDEQLFANYLSTHFMPDPDLLIRTSGEYRISNYLLWQLAYTELYFTDVLWPDFSKEELYKAIADYQTRERRFGKTSEQIYDVSK